VQAIARLANFFIENLNPKSASVSCQLWRVYLAGASRVVKEVVSPAVGGSSVDDFSAAAAIYRASGLVP
jgi:hypothetical protein